MSDFHGSVLIVEDNTDIALLLVDFFNDRGHATDYAHDGLSGLHLAATREHDAIILDLALPGLDGIELCRQLREIKHSQVPILMLTARDTLEDKLTGFQAGADDYLVKPFELLEVYARVQALCRVCPTGGTVAERRGGSPSRPARGGRGRAELSGGTARSGRPGLTRSPACGNPEPDRGP